MIRIELDIPRVEIPNMISPLLIHVAEMFALGIRDIGQSKLRRHDVQIDLEVKGNVRALVIECLHRATNIVNALVVPSLPFGPNLVEHSVMEIEDWV